MVFGRFCLIRTMKPHSALSVGGFRPVLLGEKMFGASARANVRGGASGSDILWMVQKILEQGCGIKDFFPTSVIQVGISPVMWWVSLKRLLLYHSGHFPQPCPGL